MTLLIVIIVCILLIVSLLIMPITICLDTISNQYYIQLQGIIKADLERHDAELFRIKLKFLFMKFHIYPLKKRRLRKQKKNKKKHATKFKKRISIIKLLRILKTFKVKRFLLDIDTDNCILNAKLYPLFTLLNYSGGNYYINFQGRNQLILIVKNRPINIIKSFINF